MDNEELSELLFNAVNEQGYLFQEACEHLLTTQVKKWEVAASEYPVSLGEEDTRVDIVLRAKSPHDVPELYAFVECKRADPEYVCWLFGAPGLPLGNALCYTFGLESGDSNSNAPLKINPVLKQLHFKVNTYSSKWWLEVKKASMKRASTPQNIENAFGQVLKGIGGFAQEQRAQRSKRNSGGFKVFFIPVVITTASLYVAAYEPQNVKLHTGTIAKDEISFAPHGEPPEEVEWMLVDYGVGKNVAPEHIPDNYVGVDPTELQKHKIRSIFVVNSKSIQRFFSEFSLESYVRP